MMKRRSPDQQAATVRMLQANASRRRGGGQAKAHSCGGGRGCGGAKTKPTAPRRAKVWRIVLKPSQRIRIPTTGRY